MTQESLKKEQASELEPEIKLASFWKRLTKKASKVIHPIQRCKWCNKQFKSPVKRVTNGVQIRGEYCSNSCRAYARNGKKAPRWKGGKHTRSDGYVRVFLSSNQRTGKNKYQFEHVLVMEKHLGRKLKTGEIVHHKNGKKDDNRLANLQLETQSSHTRLHKTGQPQSAQHRANLSIAMRKRKAQKGGND